MLEPKNIRFCPDGAGVDIVDQTLLPLREERIELRTKEQCREAIESLRVRGAPAIGIFAAYSLAAFAKDVPASTADDFSAAFAGLAGYFEESRPTAVNLRWACRRMVAVAEQVLRAKGEGPTWREELAVALHAEARAIQDEDARACRFMATYGLARIADGAGVVTHCNAGPLATSSYGTALGPVLRGSELGMHFHVYVDETRPLLQGARLTAFELQQAGIETTLMCDSMASVVMGAGLVDACFVGADRVAANGDVANKIGTNQLAIVAAHYGVPFYVVCPTSTIDLSCATGFDIPIEQRGVEEVTELNFVQRMAPEGIDVLNPAFDVTDHELVSAIITERGAIEPERIASLSLP